MTLFATIFAIVTLALWCAIVTGLWVVTGALGGLAFASITLFFAWIVWPSGQGAMVRETLNAFQQSLSEKYDENNNGE